MKLTLVILILFICGVFPHLVENDKSLEKDDRHKTQEDQNHEKTHHQCIECDQKQKNLQKLKHTIDIKVKKLHRNHHKTHKGKNHAKTHHQSNRNHHVENQKSDRTLSFIWHWWIKPTAQPVPVCKPGQIGAQCGSQSTGTNKRCIIYSSGGNDDAHALTILYNADKQNIIRIEAIICSLGDTDLDHACPNLVRIAEAAGRLDIPIFKGSYQPILANFTALNPLWFGKDGFGDMNYTVKPNLEIIAENPGSAVNDLINLYPKQISILVLGSSTNAALPMKFFKNYADNIKDIFVMGGKYDHKNLGALYKPGLPEHNFAVDPEATQIIFGNPKLNITLIPEEVCDDTSTNLAWRWDVLGKTNNPLCNLIKAADTALYKDLARESIWVPYDALVAAVFLNPTGITIVRNRLDIELCNKTERGKIIVRETGNGNVNVVTRLNSAIFRATILDACNYVCRGGPYICNNKYLL